MAVYVHVHGDCNSNSCLNRINVCVLLLTILCQLFDVVIIIIVVNLLLTTFHFAYRLDYLFIGTV